MDVILTKEKTLLTLLLLVVLVILIVALLFINWQGLTKNRAETGLDHPNPALRTRHYRLSAETLFITLETLLNNFPRWQILEADRRTGNIIAQRKTSLFRFVDEIQISIKKIDQKHVALNIRSASRVGKGDFGQNARNIQELLKRLDTQIASKIYDSLEASGYFEGLSNKLSAHVNRLALEIGPRHFARQAAYNKAAAYISATFHKAAYTPILEVFQVTEVPLLTQVRTDPQEKDLLKDQDYQNVVATKTGEMDEIIVVGAHYDTVVGSPGADDNTSGVAVLMELSRLLQPVKLSRTIIFVAFANEEPPFFRTSAMGSSRFLKLKDRRGKIISMFSLEMLGYYSDAPHSQSYPPLLGFFYPDRANFIAVVGNFASRTLVNTVAQGFREIGTIPLESLVAPRIVPGVDLSDQMNFWKAGIPAVMITDTAYNRNPHYHTTGDLPATLDYEKMTEVTKGLFRSLLQLGQVLGLNEDERFAQK